MNYFLAITIPFFVVMISGPFLIKLLKRINFGQQVRREGPKSHFQKEGIPTMGGVLILLGIVLSILFININNNLLVTIVVTLGMGLVGFLDDFIKIKTKKSLGLKARSKIIGQLLFSIILAIYVYNNPELGSEILLPFSGEYIDLGIMIIPLIIFTTLGTANGVNLTDGLDGLASGVTAIVSSSFAVLTAALYFEQLSIFALSITGACLGFIWYNSHPAQVFMGDVGSLALGGALASIAVISQTEAFLLIIGGVYVIETVSVIIQVSYFKITKGKRIFKMSPLHHHFELKGWQESKIVFRFILVSIVFAVIGIYSFYLI